MNPSDSAVGRPIPENYPGRGLPAVYPASSSRQNGHKDYRHADKGALPHGTPLNWLYRHTVFSRWEGSRPMMVTFRVETSPMAATNQSLYDQGNCNLGLTELPGCQWHNDLPMTEFPSRPRVHKSFAYCLTGRPCPRRKSPSPLLPASNGSRDRDSVGKQDRVLLPARPRQLLR
jgi:hypothetical protein